MKSNYTYFSGIPVALYMFLFCSFVQLNGQYQVSSIVEDINGDPLIGVNVIIKGTTNGTITNNEGRFLLSVADQDQILIFSYMGFVTREVVAGRANLEPVILEEDIELFDEVIVIGYGTQKKIDLSGSVATVNTEELESLPIKSAAEALKGRASGVYVKSNTGQPGSDPSVLVRGRTSISAENDPLIVVDGIPGVGWSEVDFNDVVSITVLKDAASAAIYGSSGANGVVLITTKRGKANKDKISFSYNSGWAFSPEKLDVLNSEQSLDLINELNKSGDLDALLGDQYISSFMIDTNNLYHTDWQDEIFRIGRSDKFNLSSSGGGDKLTYYISGSYITETGYVVPTDYDRFTYRTNLDYKFSDRLSMSTDLSFSRNSKKEVTTGEYAWNGATILTALNTYEFLPIYDQSGGYFINPFQPNVDIPTANINGKTGRKYNTNINIKYTLNFELFEGLVYQFDLMNQTGFKKGSSYTSRYHTDVGRQASGSASSSAEKGVRWDMNHILRYNRAIGNHNLEMMAGSILLKSEKNTYESVRRGFPSDTIRHAYPEDESYPGLGVAYKAAQGNPEYRKYSYIGRLNYNFKSTYFMQFNVRSDGSSRFGENYRWGTFPTGSFAVRLSELDILSGINSITELKIRYSLGITGNDAFDNYLYTSYYNAGLNHGMWNNDDVAVGYSSLDGDAPNPDLRWEESFEQSLGIDLSLFDNRVVFTGEIYDKDANDLLYKAETPPHTGFRNGWLNIGKVNTKGIDLMLTTHTISRINFRWSTTFTFSADRNEVIDMGGLGDQYRGDNIVREGEPIDAMYGWVMDGVFQSQEEIDALNAIMTDGSVMYYQNEMTAPGDIRFRNLDGQQVDSQGNPVFDINGNPVYQITNNDRQVIGKPNPDFYYGIDNQFTYRNFEFSFFFQGVYGANILSLTRREIERMDNYFNYSAVVLDRWQYEGQETNVPRATNTDPNQNNRTSTRWMEDASFLRLKYITLGYKLPQVIISKLGVSNAIVSLTGENLLTFTDYPLYDPEIATNSGRGIDMGGYPQARSFSLNVRLEF